MILLHSLAVVLATLTSIAIAQMYTGSGGYAVQTSANTSDAFYPASVRISYSTTVYTATRATTVFITTTGANFTTTLEEVGSYVTRVTDLIPVATSTISEPTAPGDSVDSGSDDTELGTTSAALPSATYVENADELVATPTNDLVPAPTTDEPPPSTSDNTVTITEDETPSPSTTLKPSLSGTFSTSFAGPASSLMDPTPDTTLPDTTAITQGLPPTVTNSADVQSQVTSEDATTQTTTAEEEEATTEPSTEDDPEETPASEDPTTAVTTEDDPEETPASEDPTTAVTTEDDPEETPASEDPTTAVTTEDDPEETPASEDPTTAVTTEDDPEETPASEDPTTAITTEARSPTALSTTVLLTLPNDEVIAFPIPTTSISIDLTDFILSGLGLDDSQTDSASFLTTTTPPTQSHSPTVDDEELPNTTTLITTSTAVGGNATETSTATDQDDEEVVPFDGRAGQVGVKDSVGAIAVAVVVIGAGLVVVGTVG
ncbi:hypothetical protein MBLNU230_g6740t1 [Neophaeotheca triangularis]